MSGFSKNIWVELIAINIGPSWEGPIYQFSQAAADFRCGSGNSPICSPSDTLSGSALVLTSFLISVVMDSMKSFSMVALCSNSPTPLGYGWVCRRSCPSPYGDEGKVSKISLPKLESVNEATSIPVESVMGPSASLSLLCDDTLECPLISSICRSHWSGSVAAWMHILILGCHETFPSFSWYLSFILSFLYSALMSYHLLLYRTAPSVSPRTAWPCYQPPSSPGRPTQGNRIGVNKNRKHSDCILIKNECSNYMVVTYIVIDWLLGFLFSFHSLNVIF